MQNICLKIANEFIPLLAQKPAGLVIPQDLQQCIDFVLTWYSNNC